MKNLFILPAILLSTVLLAACTHTTTTPTINPPSNSDMKTDPAMPTKHSNSGASNSAPMDSNEHRVSSEEGFIIGMIPHHQEAVDAAKIIVAKSENKELKIVAQAIIDAQNKEITQLK